MKSSTELDTHPLSNPTVEAFYYSPFHLFLSAHPSHVPPYVSFCAISVTKVWAAAPPPRSDPLPALARCVHTPSHDFSLPWFVRTFQHLGWGVEIDVCVVAGKNAYNELRSLQHRALKKQKKRNKTFHQRWFTLTPFHLFRLRCNWTVSSWCDGGCITFFSALFCSVILSNVLLTNTTNYFAYGASVRRKNTAGIHNRQERTKHSRVAGKWQNRLLTTIITQQCVLGVFLLLLSLPLSTCLQPHYLLLHPSYVRPSPW